jgi:hypothetical protein
VKKEILITAALSTSTAASNTVAIALVKQLQANGGAA